METSRQLTFGSLFAGIGGFDLGFERAGFSCAWQVEIDKDCNRILDRHWPARKAYQDVREFNAASVPVRPDLICGGFPCQDLSVAGKRAGLDGERSGLWFEFKRIIGEFSPRWVLIENVPGLLSSDGGRDFATVLGGLAELGYGFAYRVLDSQWFGVPQRRRRVFIVGCLGDWRRAAEILFERDSLPWDSPPSRETGTGVTPILEIGARTNGDGDRDGDGIGIAGDPMFTLQRGKQHGIATFNASDYANGCFEEHELARPITGTPDRSRGAPVVITPVHAAGCANSNGLGIGKPGDPMFTLDSTGSSAIIPIDMRQASRGDKMTNNRSEDSSGGPPGTGIGQPGDPSPTIAHSHTPAVAFTLHGSDGCAKVASETDIASALRGRAPGTIENSTTTVVLDDREFEELERGLKERGLTMDTVIAAFEGTGHPAPEKCYAFQTRIARNGRGQPKEITDALTSAHGGTHADSKPHVTTRMGIRRLTPRECERLQGFPDDWTRFDAAGNELSDSPRYRMLGNAVTPPVTEWIAGRITRQA